MPAVQIGQERLTSLSSATAPTIPSGTMMAWLQAETNDVRMRADGTPTATTGAVIRADDPPIELPYDVLKDMEFIEETASAQLNIIYFGIDT